MSTSKTGDTERLRRCDTGGCVYQHQDVTPPDTGSLTVSKTVAGNAGETDKSFRFTVTPMIEASPAHMGIWV